MVAHDNTTCVLWRADASNCTVSQVGTTRECARLSAVTCAFDGTSATLSAAVDRQCDTLPYEHCQPGASSCCGGHACSLLPHGSWICQPTSKPPALTVVNAVQADDLYNVTTGTPGSCSCETPKCNDLPSFGHRIKAGTNRTFNADNCAYFSIGGGVAETATGNVCATWRADATSCTTSPSSVTGECSRVSSVACAFDGHLATITAVVDRTCDTLPHYPCTPGTSTCCGAGNTCTLVPGSNYHMCQ